MLKQPSTNIGNDSTLRFALICTLLLLVAVWLEPHLGPLNRLTAALSGKTLTMFGYSPLVRGDLITLDGFMVQIISECTSLYATLLLTAFILAWPATWSVRLVGIAAGSLVIGIVNILRIAGVTVIGTMDPVRFEIFHVYLAQVVMLLLVIFCGLTWTRWSSDRGGNNAFLFNSICWSTILFLPWLFVHKKYLAFLDIFVRQIFIFIDSSHTVRLWLDTGIYNHPFSVPLYLALLLASTGISSRRRICGAIIGVLIISAGHLLFRITHVVWTMFDLKLLADLHRIVYLLGQLLLPVFIWLRVINFTTGKGAAPGDGEP